MLNAERMEPLRKLIEAQADATLAELGGRMDWPFGTSNIDLWMRKMGLSYKKNALRRGAKTGPTCKGDAGELA